MNLKDNNFKNQTISYFAEKRLEHILRLKLKSCARANYSKLKLEVLIRVCSFETVRIATEVGNKVAKV